jgi:hypothetical protein
VYYHTNSPLYDESMRLKLPAGEPFACDPSEPFLPLICLSDVRCDPLALLGYRYLMPFAVVE